MSKVNKSSITRWYTNEIQNIMHGFGDSSRPMAESAHLIEEIVHQQMTSLLNEARKIAHFRGTSVIGMEEILFLMRKDKVKLARLLRYLSIKDVRGRVASKLNSEEGSLDIQSANFSHLGLKQSSSQPSSKRIKLCHDFISSIDQTGELLTSFNEGFFDEIRHQRNLRMDRMTSNMTKAQYLRYSEARQANFADKSKPKCFREWLSKDDPQELKLNLHALEIFQYLAYETVAEIVDIALLVKQDREIKSNDPVSGLISLKMKNSDYPIFSVSSSNQKDAPNPPSEVPTETEKASVHSDKHSKMGLTSFSSGGSDCIRPSDVREAVRRFNQPKGVFSTMDRCYIKPHKFICL